MPTIMRVKLSRQLRNFLLLACALLIFGQAQANDAITPEELRAAYLANVIHYITWPNESVRQTLTIGVLGSPQVYRQLQAAPLGTIRGLNIEVVELTRPSNASEVDILYIAPAASHLLNSTFGQVRSRPILMITEHSPAREEMMINLVATSQNRLGFQVNTDRIESAGLRLTADL